MAVESLASGANGRRVAVSALRADGATAASTVVFDGFGRVTGANPIASIDLDNLSSGNDFRRLRIVIASGGSIRMCDPQVTSSTDPRFC
jgi:type IV fimbrial biogenesis protein FimT